MGDSAVGPSCIVSHIWRTKPPIVGLIHLLVSLLYVSRTDRSVPDELPSDCSKYSCLRCKT